jgi:hypothetical protein
MPTKDEQGYAHMFPTLASPQDGPPTKLTLTEVNATATAEMIQMSEPQSRCIVQAPPSQQEAAVTEVCDHFYSRAHLLV